MISIYLLPDFHSFITESYLSEISQVSQLIFWCNICFFWQCKSVKFLIELLSLLYGILKQSYTKRPFNRRLDVFHILWMFLLALYWPVLFVVYVNGLSGLNEKKRAYHYDRFLLGIYEMKSIDFPFITPFLHLITIT